MIDCTIILIVSRCGQPKSMAPWLYLVCFRHTCAPLSSLSPRSPAQFSLSPEIFFFLLAPLGQVSNSVYLLYWTSRELEQLLLSLSRTRAVPVACAGKAFSTALCRRCSCTHKICVQDIPLILLIYIPPYIFSREFVASLKWDLEGIYVDIRLRVNCSKLGTVSVVN